MTDQKVVAIVQARTGSTRLPNKVLAEICGEPMLVRVVERARKAKLVHEVLVATTSEPEDDVLVSLCGTHGIPVFRGAAHDVLDRYVGAARFTNADIIVRITADSPLIDPSLIDSVIKVYVDSNVEFVSNGLQLTYPDGMDVEVFSTETLEKTAEAATAPGDREHVTRFIRMSGRFTTENVASDLPGMIRRIRFSVDEPADLEFVRAVTKRLGSDPNEAGLPEIIELLEREPELMEINDAVIRDRWYYDTIADEPGIEGRDLDLEESLRLKARAAQVVPSYTQTFSKNPSQFVQGASPVYLRRGEGSHVWDVDDNEYIDYILGLGPISLGYNYPAVTEAVKEQITQGTSFSLAHPIELEVAELLTEIIPCAEMVRFGKNGSDVTSAAVRAARAFTERDVIALSGYHGWQDWYIGTTSRARGIPEAVRDLSKTFSYNDIDSLKAIFDDNPGQVAGVILEPFGTQIPEPGFLESVQELATETGAVLIFDEVITGFRLGLGGAQEYFGVTPDLACFGKAMANGYPVSAVVGRRDIMELFDEIFFSFTFGGEAVSLAAARATINEMQTKDVFGHIWEQGQKLKDGFNVLAEKLALHDYMRCDGLAPRTVIAFDDSTQVIKSLFQQEAAARGVLSAGYHNVCYSLSNDDVEHTLRAYKGVLEIIAQAIDSGDPRKYLKGDPLKPVFRAL